METVNAIIDYERISIERESFVTARIGVEYGDGSKQGFGGDYCLHNINLKPPSKTDLAGYHMAKIMQCAGVTMWHQLVGKPIRVTSDGSRILAIGHITKEIWYCPSGELKDD